MRLGFTSLFPSSQRRFLWCSTCPFQITRNSCSIIRAFEIICRRLRVYLTIRIFFSFYYTWVSVCWGWATLVGLSGRVLFKPHSNYFKGYKDKFVRTSRHYISPLVTTGAYGTPKFPLAYTDISCVINGYNHTWINVGKAEVVRTLDEFKLI